jgi:gas vesicle protein
MNIELWSGFFGTIIGAIIGGYIAYLIAKFQFNRQERQFQAREAKNKVEKEVQELKDKDAKEVQLLWQIYFDIKRDSENSKLWDKYDEILQKREGLLGSSTAEYILETLTYIMRNLRNLFKLLDGKEGDFKTDRFTELDLLWDRAGQYLIFLMSVYKRLSQFSKITTSELLAYYEESNALFQKHSKAVLKN